MVTKRDPDPGRWWLVAIVCGRQTRAEQSGRAGDLFGWSIGRSNGLSIGRAIDRLFGWLFDSSANQRAGDCFIWFLYMRFDIYILFVMGHT